MKTLMKKLSAACARNWLSALVWTIHLLIALLAGWALVKYPLPALLLGLVNAVTAEFSMRYARRRFWDQEAQRIQRNAEDLTPYLPVTRAVGVLGTDPQTWTEAQYALIRAAFVAQHPHVACGFQHAVVLWSTDNEVAFRCAHRADAADWEAWGWTVNRLTGEFCPAEHRLEVA